MCLFKTANVIQDKATLKLFFFPLSERIVKCCIIYHIIWQIFSFRDSCANVSLHWFSGYDVWKRLRPLSELKCVKEAYGRILICWRSVLIFLWPNLLHLFFSAPTKRTRDMYHTCTWYWSIAMKMPSLFNCLFWLFSNIFYPYCLCIFKEMHERCCRYVNGNKGTCKYRHMAILPANSNISLVSVFFLVVVEDLNLQLGTMSCYASPLSARTWRQAA